MWSSGSGQLQFKSCDYKIMRSSGRRSSGRWLQGEAPQGVEVGEGEGLLSRLGLDREMRYRVHEGCFCSYPGWCGNP